MVGDNTESENRTQKVETGPGLSDDQLYRALSSTKRRRLLYILLVEEETTIEKIATVLSGWDATETGKMVSSNERERILIELDHIHFPLLTEAGLITYGRQERTVKIEPLSDTITDLICQSVETELPSSP